MRVLLDSGLRYVDKFGGLHGMMKSIRANEPGKLNKSRVRSPGGCNDIKSLSGIETKLAEITEIKSPYDGEITRIKIINSSDGYLNVEFILLY